MTLDEAYDQFRLSLDKYFPNLFRSTGYCGPNFHAELPNENKAFRDTPYFYKGELSFIHWTSIDNLLSIINNREFRLYNLHNSNDENEFNFAAIELNMENDEIEYAKKYYYTFSFCKKEDLSNDYLWKEYGNDSSGVAIEFSIENNPIDWENYMISNVYYAIPGNFKPLVEELSELKQKGIGFRGLNLGKFIGFHKKGDYHNEKEVRIATYFPFKNSEEYLKFAKTEFRIDKISKRNRITNYISLPLWVNNDSVYIKSDKPN